MTFQTGDRVGVIGAGTMGAGIAQVAAAAGHEVKLFDVASGAAEKALKRIQGGLERLVQKGKKEQSYCDGIMSRLQVVETLDDLADCRLVIEAIIEKLEPKHALLKSLEKILADDAVIASNTSSISVSAIASVLNHPQRVVGMHFFNPAPVMKLVEVVHGIQTSATVADDVYRLALEWGKKPIHAKSTPGFVANRVARPFYAEALKLLEEKAADAETIDQALKHCAGFRMGPFELMDLIGVDVNYDVTCSVFEAMYFDPKFRPSLIQKEMVLGGLHGRKTGSGFYHYVDGKKQTKSAQSQTSTRPERVVLAGVMADIPGFGDQLQAAGVTVHYQEGDGRIYLNDAVITCTDGRTATLRSHEDGLENLILMDWVDDFENSGSVVLAAGDLTTPQAKDSAEGLFAALNKEVLWVDDLPGMIVARVLSLLINEGADTVAAGVCDETAVDLATRFGLNYPKGPLTWADELGLPAVHAVITHLSQAYGDDHYRMSRLLRRRVAGHQKFHIQKETQ